MSNIKLFVSCTKLNHLNNVIKLTLLKKLNFLNFFILLSIEYPNEQWRDIKEFLNFIQARN